MRLTKAFIDSLAYAKTPPKQDIRWDSEIRGFGVRVYPSGKKSFVISYRSNGRKHIMVLGPYGVLTLVQARELAQARLAAVIVSNADPIEERKVERLRGTVGSLCDAYLERHAQRKKSYDADRRRIEKFIRPAWGNLKLTAVRKADVSDLHHKLTGTPYEANRVLSLVKTMFNLADDWGFLPDGTKNPATRIGRFPEEKRERFLAESELRRLGEVLDHEKNPFIVSAIWLYLLTGMRKSEILRLKWESVDFERAEITLTAKETKAKRSLTLPLSEPAMRVLRAIPVTIENPYVFPGRKKGKPLATIAKPWDGIRKAAGIEDVRIHDLRRTVGSYMAQRGVTLNLIAKVLNHSNLSTTQIYARFSQDAVRETLEKHGEGLLTITGQVR